MIIAVSSCRNLQNKHLKLGIAIKSFTENKVLDMLNRYVHCANYQTVEESDIVEANI